MSDSPWLARHRLFVAPEALAGTSVQFDRDRSHQLARVLRVGPKEPVIVLTGDGREHLVRLVDVNPKACQGEVLESREARGEPRLRITLYQGLLPRDRFEQALIKSIEVGVSRVVPLRTQRVVARIDDRDWPHRAERLRAIAREAAEQSERAVVPEIAPPLALATAVQQACAEGPVIMGWERGDETLVRPRLADLARAPAQALSIIVGPEGGFEQAEVDLAQGAGVHLVWLGPRVLRSETAGPVLAALMLYESGDLGPESERE